LSFGAVPIGDASIENARDIHTRFNKTYHIQLQLESIVLKGKSLPDVLPAVAANFIAEMETLVLTAGHDVAQLRGPISSGVLYVAYAPAGVPTELVASQLQGIEANIRLFAPKATVEQQRLLTAAYIIKAG